MQPSASGAHVCSPLCQACPPLLSGTGLQDVPGLCAGAGEPQGTTGPAVSLPSARHPEEGISQHLRHQLLLQGKSTQAPQRNRDGVCLIRSAMEYRIECLDQC